MVMFTSCEVAFYKLNIYDASFTSYHMVESNFSRINLCKLCERTILIKMHFNFHLVEYTLAECY